MRKIASAFIFTLIFATISLAQVQPESCRKVVSFQQLSTTRIDSDIVSDPTIQAKALIQLIENNYGPLVMKPNSVGVDWNQMKQDLLNQVLKAESTNELHFIFNSFLARFNDGHISNPIPSTLSMHIPLDFVAIEGKILVAGHDPALFPKSQRIPNKGDEIIKINGEPITEFQKKFSAWNSSGNNQVNLATFAMGLTRWSEQSGIPVSQFKSNELTLTIETPHSETYEIKVSFKKVGLGIIGRDIDLKDPAPVVVNADQSAKSDELNQILGLKKHNTGTIKILESVDKMFKVLKEDTILNSSPASKNSSRMVIGQPTPFFKLPEDFKPIKFPFFGATKNMLGGDVLMAGTFQRNGKTIGFLRIGSYSISNFLAMEISIRRIIGQLNALTDTLIIDQTNNPGGYVIFADLMIKSLVGQFDESRHIKFAVKPTQDFLRQYAETIQEIRRNTDGKLTNEQVLSFTTRLEAEYKKIYQAYIEGKNLSDPVSMLVFTEYIAITIGDQLLASPIARYAAKKLLGEHVLTPQVFKGKKMLLCNELCFSGGDAFPAMFQDYQLGETYGLTTAGAGGTVIPFQLNGFIPLQGSITNSLMVRHSGALVENYGVTPKNYLSIRREDVANNYSNYFEHVLKQMGL